MSEMPPTPDTLPPFPVDDVTLAAVEHAMDGAYTIDDEGNHHLVGADYSLNDLLEFLSGYDESRLHLLDEGTEDDQVLGFHGHIPVYEYDGQVYHEHDLIRALISEVRRLRAATDER